MTRIAYGVYRSISAARCMLWRLMGVSFGRNVYIGSKTVFSNGAQIRIGDDVRISRFCTIEGGKGGLVIGSNVGIGRNSWFAGDGSIRIGSYVQFGPNVNVLSFSHTFVDPDVPIMRQADSNGPIDIADDVWVAANVVILPDTSIGRGCVVAANSVVRGTYPPLSIIGGSPAKVIGLRGDGRWEVTAR